MIRKVCVVTPVYGSPSAASVSLGYHEATSKLLRDENVEFMASRIVTNCDLVRARSRAVRMFLEKTEMTDLLFWDEDVVPRDVMVISAMIQSGKDMISAPYPRKQFDWDRVSDGVRDEEEVAELGRQGGPDLEGLAVDWPMRVLDEKVNPDGLMRANEVGLGFTIIRRQALERMVDVYKGDLTFIDSADGQRFPTVALFQLMIDKDRNLLSEDYSFCRRWRDIGGECWIILDPAYHVGRHKFGSSNR